MRLPDAANDTRGLLLTRITGSTTARLPHRDRASDHRRRQDAQWPGRATTTGRRPARRLPALADPGARRHRRRLRGHRLRPGAQRHAALHATARIEAVSSSNLDTRIAASDQPAELGCR